MKTTIFVKNIHDLSTTDIAKQIRKDLKEECPKFKFSVTSEYFSWGSAINLAIMSGPIEIYTKEYLEALKNAKEKNTRELRDIVQDLQERHWNKMYVINWEDYIEYTKYTKEWEEVIKKAKRIHDLYNHDNSDAMTDYFDVNYYGSVEVWKWDKPYQKI